jgi:hypothetical protein
VSKQYTAFLRKAFSRYLSRLNAGGIEPKLTYLPYDFEDELKKYALGMVGDMMIKDELREITNIVNHWHGQLLRWHAWNKVLPGYDQDDAWNLRREFLEALSHHCLLSPAAARDTLTFVATNSIHQLRLALEAGYKDHLDGDPTKPGKKPAHLTRAKKEKRLEELLMQWTEGAHLVSAIRSIDDKAYRDSTWDYRNRSSHAIGPRLALGHTQAVTRLVQQATEFKDQGNGTFKDGPVPDKMSVSYAIGGTPPLDMEESRVLNLAQYHKARAAYLIYRDLLLNLARVLPKSS